MQAITHHLTPNTHKVDLLGAVASQWPQPMARSLIVNGSQQELIYIRSGGRNVATVWLQPSLNEGLP